MFFKLALKNIRKSFKDYTLYFLTLTFAVCIFYVFNSIEAQKAMMSISRSASAMLQTITQLMGMISVFVSFILGFLIVYANNFLIRKRKKEFGIYMTLGMEKGKVAKLLVAETFLIGVLSLGAGLLAGVFLSQGLSVVTAKLFEVDMTGYTFIFSPDAFVKTIIYFGVIFLIVMFASTVSISKYKLIDLINAEKQNEKQKLKNPVITIILFILSVACIGTAYKLVLKNGILYFDKMLAFEIILGSIGTFLFFASLPGFFLKLIQSNKKRYFKGLNMFILRQINSRINTAHISISLICLMLFCTIGILSTGMGLNDALNDSYKYCAPYDVSFQANGDVNIIDMFKGYGFDISKYIDKSVEFKVYMQSENKLTKGVIFEKVADLVPENYRAYYMETPLFLIRNSDFNKLMLLQGIKGIQLSENQVAIYSDYAATYAELKNCLLEYLDKKYTITISDKIYNVCDTLLMDGVITTPSSGIMLALIVPDKLVEGSTVYQTILSFNCNGDRKSTQLKLEDDMYNFLDKNKHIVDESGLIASTGETVKSIAAGQKALVTFLGIYVGLIFLITSAAVLALQQLSEAADNRCRYEILQKIGADDSLINSALFKQIAIYFLLPLALACVHSIVGIKVANDAINEASGINVLTNIIVTAILITIIYGSYFLATYFSSKRIILRSKA